MRVQRRHMLAGAVLLVCIWVFVDLEYLTGGVQFIQSQDVKPSGSSVTGTGTRLGHKVRHKVPQPPPHPTPQDPWAGAYDALTIAQERKRLDIVLRQYEQGKIGHSNPLVQPVGPRACVHPSTPYTQQDRSLYPSETKEMVSLGEENNEKLHAEAKEIRKKCPLCTDNYEAFTYMWRDFLKRKYADGVYTIEKPGVYIEMGALDGIEGANTIFFDFFQWAGILIEPNPVNFARLLQVRQHTQRVELAACPCPFTHRTPLGVCHLEFLGEHGSTAGAHGLMGTEAKSFFHGDRQDYYNVSCLPMQDILDHTVPQARGVSLNDTNGIIRVDFWSLDVEGAEVMTLRTVDWSRTKIWLILVEFNKAQGGEEAMKELRDTLKALGYKRRQLLGMMNQLWEDPTYWE